MTELAKGAIFSQSWMPGYIKQLNRNRIGSISAFREPIRTWSTSQSWLALILISQHTLQGTLLQRCLRIQAWMLPSSVKRWGIQTWPPLKFTSIALKTGRLMKLWKIYCKHPTLANVYILISITDIPSATKNLHLTRYIVKFTPLVSIMKIIFTQSSWWPSKQTVYCNQR